jgi:alkyl hydroperoxide reductase subunit F
MREGIYDTVIVGAGPAGISAAIYAVRKRMNFLLISENIGGQVLTSGDIENFLGYAEIDGVQLVDRMIAQMHHLGIEPFLDRVVNAEREEDVFLLKTLSGQEIRARTLLLCTGSEHRKLNVP